MCHTHTSYALLLHNWQPNCTKNEEQMKMCVNVYFDLSSKFYLTFPETASSDSGISFTAATAAATNDSSNSLLFLKPPPGSEIPRSASVSGALPRPRPQVERSANRNL